MKQHSFTYANSKGGKIYRKTVPFDLIALGYRLSITRRSCCIYFEKDDLQIKMNRTGGELSLIKDGSDEWLVKNQKISNQEALIYLLSEYK